jgi:DNA-binding SARP family transcriptional activator
MSDTILKNALADFEHDLKRTIDDLRIAIASIVDPNEDATDDVLTEKGNGVVGVDRAELQDLLERLSEGPEAVSDAFESFGWEIRRALRELKQAVVQHHEGAL